MAARQGQSTAEIIAALEAQLAQVTAERNAAVRVTGPAAAAAAASGTGPRRHLGLGALPGLLRHQAVAPAAAAGAFPDRYRPVIDGPFGHILAYTQVEALHFGERGQNGIFPLERIFGRLVNSFRDAGVLNPAAPGTFSFLYCPFIWRILRRSHPDIPVEWETYGGAVNNLDGDGEHFRPDVANRREALFGEGAEIAYWTPVIEEALAVPGYLEWLEGLMTRVPNQGQGGITPGGWGRGRRRRGLPTGLGGRPLRRFVASNSAASNSTNQVVHDLLNNSGVAAMNSARSTQVATTASNILDFVRAVQRPTAGVPSAAAVSAPAPAATRGGKHYKKVMRRTRKRVYA